MSSSAGGANVLVAFAKRYLDLSKCEFCFKGAALDLLQKEFNRKSIASFSLLDNFPSHDTVAITGTSGRPELEREAISIFKELGILTYSILDHWGNFKLRFIPYHLWEEGVDNVKDYLPDYVVTLDSSAYKLALEEGFPENILLQISNPYIEELKDKFLIAEKTPNDKTVILYISEYFSLHNENIKKEHACKQYTEFNYVEDIMHHLYAQKPKQFKLIFRLHPSEDKKKYEYLQQSYPDIEFSVEKSLMEDFARSDIVLGRTSMALYIAGQLMLPSFSYKVDEMVAPPERDGVQIIDDMTYLYGLLKEK